MPRKMLASWRQCLKEGVSLLPPGPHFGVEARTPSPCPEVVCGNPPWLERCQKWSVHQTLTVSLNCLLEDAYDSYSKHPSCPDSQLSIKACLCYQIFVGQTFSFFHAKSHNSAFRFTNESSLFLLVIEKVAEGGVLNSLYQFVFKDPAPSCVHLTWY